MENEVLYSYVDTLGNKYGPYGGQQMMLWYNQNLLANSLCIHIEAVNRNKSKCVISLQKLIERLGKDEPFPNTIRDNQINGFLTSGHNHLVKIKTEKGRKVKMKPAIEIKKENDDDKTSQHKPETETDPSSSMNQQPSSSKTGPIEAGTSSCPTDSSPNTEESTEVTDAPDNRTPDVRSENADNTTVATSSVDPDRISNDIQNVAIAQQNKITVVCNESSSSVAVDVIDKTLPVKEPTFPKTIKESINYNFNVFGEAGPTSKDTIKRTKTASPIAFDFSKGISLINNILSKTPTVPKTIARNKNVKQKPKDAEIAPPAALPKTIASKESEREAPKEAEVRASIATPTALPKTITPEKSSKCTQEGTETEAPNAPPAASSKTTEPNRNEKQDPKKTDVVASSAPPAAAPKSNKNEKEAPKEAEVKAPSARPGAVPKSNKNEKSALKEAKVRESNAHPVAVPKTIVPNKNVEGTPKEAEVRAPSEPAAAVAKTIASNKNVEEVQKESEIRASNATPANVTEVIASKKNEGGKRNETTVEAPNSIPDAVSKTIPTNENEKEAPKTVQVQAPIAPPVTVSKTIAPNNKAEEAPKRLEIKAPDSTPISAQKTIAPKRVEIRAPDPTPVAALKTIAPKRAEIRAPSASQAAVPKTVASNKNEKGDPKRPDVVAPSTRPGAVPKSNKNEKSAPKEAEVRKSNAHPVAVPKTILPNKNVVETPKVAEVRAPNSSTVIVPKTSAQTNNGKDSSKEAEVEVVDVVSKKNIPDPSQPRTSYPLLRRPVMFHIVPEDKAHLKLFQLESTIINLPKFYYDFCDDVPIPERPYCELCEVQLETKLEIFEHLICRKHTQKLLKEGFTYQDVHFWICSIDAICLRGGQTINNVMYPPETIQTNKNGKPTIPLLDARQKVPLSRVFEVNHAKQLWSSAKQIISCWGKEEEKEFNVMKNNLTLHKRACAVCSSTFNLPFELLQHVFTRTHIKKFHEYFGPDEVRYWWNKIETTMMNVKRAKTTESPVCEVGTQTEQEAEKLEAPLPAAIPASSIEYRATPLLMFPSDENRNQLCSYEQFKECFADLQLKINEYTEDDEKEVWLTENEMKCEICSKIGERLVILKTNDSALEHITSESHSFILKYVSCLPSDFEFWSSKLVEKIELLKKRKNNFVTTVLLKSANSENSEGKDNYEDLQEIMNLVRKARGNVDVAEFDRLFPDILNFGKMCEFCSSSTFQKPSDILLHVTSLHHLVKMKGLPKKDVWMKWIEYMGMARRKFEPESCSNEKRSKMDSVDY